MRENTKKYGTGFGLVTAVATLVVGLVLGATPADAQRSEGSRVSARWAGAVDTHSMAAVNAGYWSQYATTQAEPIAWIGGSLLGCLAGLVAPTTNEATLSAMNYVRSLAGLAPVTESPALSASAQQAALMMSANGTLDHHPSSAWKCYTPTGAAAAGRSNLALSYPAITAGQIIDLYMDDPGGSNTAAGHRRWVLNPFSTAVGIGSTSTANALTVIGPSSPNRPNPKYVGWPTAGYFPNAMEPEGRWSLSAGRKNVSFAKANIKVYGPTGRLAVHKYHVENGYAQPTVVWQMPAGFSTTSAYRVVVSNIRHKGSKKRFKTAYTVNLFAPTH